MNRTESLPMVALRGMTILALFELYRIKCGDIGKITAIQNEAGENFEKG